ncbi:hypothetical protein BLOT_011133 [Blomia tropicalis]|nr:hypothetical protein BLOT_011133 [Blomia tropicalis]
MDYLDYFDLCIVNTKVVDSIRFLSISPSRYWANFKKNLPDFPFKLSLDFVEFFQCVAYKI